MIVGGEIMKFFVLPHISAKSKAGRDGCDMVVVDVKIRNGNSPRQRGLSESLFCDMPSCRIAFGDKK